MNLFEKPYRHRFMWIFIKLAVVLFAFVSSRDAKAILYYVFRLKASHKSICEWSKKFPEEIPKRKLKYKKDKTIICFADEKFVWIKGVKAYWWSIKDNYGNVLAKVITMSRDYASAVELFRRAKEAIDGEIHAIVHDGLRSYDRAVKKVFGRKCKSIIAGIQGKFVIINKELYWITNNSAESLNAQIDSYYARFNYNFESLESANRFADMFMYRKNLREACI